MLAEALRHAFLSPAPKWIKRMGYVRESVALAARHKRCRKAWAPHLDATRRLIADAAAETPSTGKAIVLGSGHLLDIPLDDLTSRFDEVLLADIHHPPPARRAARKYANVTLVDIDLSGVAEAVYNIGPYENPPEPRLSAPVPEDADLVISANLISQLPLMPVDWLSVKRTELSEETLEAFARGIVDHHLAMLQNHPGRVVLITEVLRRIHDREKTLQKIDPLFGAPLYYEGEEWTWDIAPMGEVDRRYGLILSILGVGDLKNAPQSRVCRNTTLADP